MREDFLHHIWKYQKLTSFVLQTTDGATIELINFGTHNTQSPGPDFSEISFRYNGLITTGNAEIHIRSSDWYAHHHETDAGYDDVVLHLVWEHDISVFSNDDRPIPTVVLADYVSPDFVDKYIHSFGEEKNYQFIPCEKFISQTDDLLLKDWIQIMYQQRLLYKCQRIYNTLEQTTNNWEEVLFRELTRAFGFKINTDSFESLAASIPLTVFRKCQNTVQVEAMLLGQAQLLNGQEIYDTYYSALVREYDFLVNKYGLVNEKNKPPTFFRLRPPSFPTIRLSQLGSLYQQHQSLFSLIINAQTTEDFYQIFEVEASEYWKTHYTFGKESKQTSKPIAKSFITLLIINVLIPIQKVYYDSIQENRDAIVQEMMATIKSEKNTMIDKFNKLGISTKSAMESQALIGMYNNYCSPRRCMRCNIGKAYLKS